MGRVRFHSSNQSSLSSERSLVSVYTECWVHFSQLLRETWFLDSPPFPLGILLLLLPVTLLRRNMVCFSEKVMRQTHSPSLYCWYSPSFLCAYVPECSRKELFFSLWCYQEGGGNRNNLPSACLTPGGISQEYELQGSLEISFSSTVFTFRALDLA